MDQPTNVRMDQPTNVLLCAVPGTRLSAIAKTLEKRNDAIEGESQGDSSDTSSTTTRVWDLEARICDHYRTRDDGPPEYSMFEVVTKPRQDLYETWTSQYKRMLSDIKSANADVHILCMHLTWYNAAWKEFYSPVNVLSLTDKDFSIGHIIVLIDDIYDMFRRLEKRYHLYDEATMKPTRDLIAKLSEPPDRPHRLLSGLFRSGLFAGLFRRQRDAFEARRVKIQGVELALGELLAWRRAEMMHAESIARSLNCELTVLGTKHTKSSIDLLARKPDAPRIYLSHRISEPRRALASESSKLDQAEAWSPVAAEVNKLHDAICDRGLVLINPTAIDELRYGNSEKTYRRSPLLTPRWPLPERDLISEPTSRPPDHSDILVTDLPHDDEIASHIARSLSIQISSDVSFRDHFIVENTPNLCVYRPFHCERSLRPRSKPEWSGGVLAELRHWMRCIQHHLEQDAKESDGQRRIAFVHTRAEIAHRLQHVAIDEGTTFKQNIVTHTQGVTVPDRAQDQTGSSPLDTSQQDQDVLTAPGGFRTTIESAAYIACDFAFTRVMREEPPAYILLIAVDESADGRVDGLKDLATDLKDFFTDSLSEEEVGKRNKSFLADCRSIFEGLYGDDLLLYALKATGNDSPRARRLLGIEDKEESST